MPSETGADRLLRALQQRGVDTLFGLCGDHVNPIFVAAPRHGIRIVDVRHESAAVHMADGYARTSGRIGVSVVTGGPGHTNSITGIATAAAAGSPVIAISGSYEPEQRGKLAFQEMDQAAIVQPLAKSSRLLTRPEELDEAIGAACSTALSGRPGPAHLSIPLSLLSRQAGEARAPEPRNGGARGPQRERAPSRDAGAAAAPGPSPDPAVVADLVRRLRAAERPVLIVGSGGFWAGAQHELQRFVETTQTPCFTIDLARGLLADAHALCFGYADPVLNAAARAFVEADFILLVGKRLDFRLGFGSPRVFAPSATLAQVDVLASEFERNRPAQIRILADARQALEALASEAGPRWPEKPWVRHLRALRSSWEESWREGEASDASPVHPLRICKEARALLDDRTVIVFDGGDWPQWPRMSLQASRPGHWIRLGALGTVGAGLPLALGAQAARPEERVILFIGDGGMGFHPAELHTAVRHRLNLVIVVGNDQGWGMEREIQAALYGAEAVNGCELGAVRYSEIARAFGAHGEEVARAADIRPALERAFAAGRPALVDIALRKGSVSPLTAASIAAKRV
jgi:acetolactate synthase-1/2/3 large subunit